MGNIEEPQNIYGALYMRHMGIETEQMDISDLVCIFEQLVVEELTDGEE